MTTTTKTQKAMSLKRRTHFNVDRLRLCYKQPQQLFDDVTSLENGDEMDCGYFRLKVIDNGRASDNELPPTNATALITYWDGSKDVSMGELTLNNSAKYKGRCFLSFAQPSLYDCQGRDVCTGEKYNHLCYLPYVSDVLGLQLNNITLLEIAADSNYNPIPAIRRLVHDHQNYDMILRGKKVADANRKIGGYYETYGRSRERQDRYPTLNFRSEKDPEYPKLRIYNKTREILESSGKKYEEAWNEYGNHAVFRAEIELRNESYRQWLSYIRQYKAEWGYLEDAEHLLLSEEYRTAIWLYCTRRMLYFKPKGKRKKIIDLADIISGEA